MDDYGGEAFHIASSSEDRAYYFDDGLGAPALDPPYDVTSTAIQLPSTTALNDAAGVYALIESISVALEANGLTTEYNGVGGVAKEKWAIIFADDITASDVWDKIVFIYSPAQPAAPGIFPQIQDVVIAWYQTSAPSPPPNTDYWTGSPPAQGLFYGQNAIPQIAAGANALSIALATAAAIAAVVGPASEAVFTATLNIAAGTWTLEVDFSAFDAATTAMSTNYLSLLAATQVGDNITDEEIYDVWCSFDAFGMAPMRGVDGEAELAIVTGDDAEDEADKFMAVINTNWASKFTASKLSANVVQVVSDSPFNFIYAGQSGWEGIAWTNKRNGSASTDDVTLEVECIKSSPTVPWVKHSSNGPGAKVTLSQVTAGTYHPNDHVLGINISGTPVAAPGHITTDASDLTIIDNT